jgi:hypothetical protein
MIVFLEGMARIEVFTRLSWEESSPRWIEILLEWCVGSS